MKSPVGFTGYIFIWLSVGIATNIDLLISNNHVILNDMDVYGSCMLEQNSQGPTI